LEDTSCNINKNDVIIYSNLYEVYSNIEYVGLVLDVNFNLWIGRKDITVLSNNKIDVISENMITYRKV